MGETRFKLNYRGSLFWLIFWFIIFFPVALVLLFTASSFNFNQTIYNLEYAGSRFWLGFWTLVFFPIAFILLFINGLTVTAQKPEALLENQPPKAL